MAKTKQSIRKDNLAKKTIKVPKKVKPALTYGNIIEHFKWEKRR